MEVSISGSDFSPPGPESVPAQMEEFGHWLSRVSVPSDKAFAGPSGLVSAGVAHTWFVTIHPFIDGNGRVGRLLMNLMLMRHGYPIAIITKEDRLRYYDALESSQAPTSLGSSPCWPSASRRAWRSTKPPRRSNASRPNGRPPWQRSSPSRSAFGRRMSTKSGRTPWSCSRARRLSMSWTRLRRTAGSISRTLAISNSRNTLLCVAASLRSAHGSFASTFAGATPPRVTSSSSDMLAARPLRCHAPRGPRGATQFFLLRTA